GQNPDADAGSHRDEDDVADALRGAHPGLAHDVARAVAVDGDGHVEPRVEGCAQRYMDVAPEVRAPRLAVRRAQPRHDHADGVHAGGVLGDAGDRLLEGWRGGGPPPSVNTAVSVHATDGGLRA